MKLEEQVIGLESAKRLKELGVEQESLFYWSENESLITQEEYDNFTEWVECVGKPAGSVVEQHFSAFTVAELAHLLQKSTAENFVKAYIEVMGFLDEAPQDLSIARHMHNISHNPNIGAKMLIYLLENKLITL